MAFGSKGNRHIMSEQYTSLKAILLAGIAPPAIQSLLLLLDDGPITVQYV